MNAGLLLAIALAGGVGAAARLVLDGVVRGWLGTRYPWGTAVINLTGSFLLGMLTSLAVTIALPQLWSLALGTGLLGGYTTFSTASFETVRLVQERRWAAAVGNGVGLWVLAVLFAIGGYALGTWM
ncbi:fluoride efflux transporter FluC [Amnibacterium sp.]|uniref:fluoride efflux transporter FluC n=1 Tax=Amnibacterium sp. TaxID=1872496 RepID=UPI003F7B77B7